MNTLKSMFMAVFLTVFVGSANAAVVVADLGDVANSDMTVDRYVDVGLFDEDSLFSLSVDQIVAGVASNWFIPNPIEGVLYDIEILSLTFSQDVGGIWNTLFTSDIASDSSIFFNSALTAGDYKINVTGIGIGEQGGRYALHGEFTAPVPEPSIIALMLGGLGLVLWRKRKKSRKLVTKHK